MANPRQRNPFLHQELLIKRRSTMLSSQLSRKRTTSLNISRLPGVFRKANSLINWYSNVGSEEMVVGYYDDALICAIHKITLFSNHEYQHKWDRTVRVKVENNAENQICCYGHVITRVCSSNARCSKGVSEATHPESCSPFKPSKPSVFCPRSL